MRHLLARPLGQTGKGNGMNNDVPLVGATLLVGDEVWLDDGTFRITATVIQKERFGGFSVEWHGGINPFVPGIVGHWFARFNEDGSNYFEWHRWRCLGKELPS